MAKHEQQTAVSIVCTNYNKGDWIGEAIESFLMQKTDFKYEIILIDDKSTDHSVDIIRKYAKKYPQQIRAFYNDKNLGITKTWIKVCKEVKGKYIARCDGDDYWTDTNKLQMQVDALEKSKNSKWCSTDYDVINSSGETTHKAAIETGYINRPTSYAEMLVTKGMTMASTWLVDTKLMQKINLMIDKDAVDDTFNIQLELFYHTKLTYLPVTTTVYRMSDNSDSRPEDHDQTIVRREKLLKAQKSYIDKYQDFAYKAIIENFLDRSLDYDGRYDLIINQRELINGHEQQIKDLENNIASLEARVNEILNSRKYRLGVIALLPFVKIRNFFMKLKQITKRFTIRILPLIVRVVYLRVFGLQIFNNHYTRKIPIYGRLLRKLDDIMLLKHAQHERQMEYAKWYKKNFPKKSNLESQRKKSEEFDSQPLISILVPVYNPDLRYFKECIESVLSQAYDNWELCLADDASTDDTVREIIKDCANKDSRVKYIFRKKNGHICEATNSALEIATGEYVALLDNDDVLWPNALYEVVKSVNENHPDFIYSDEDKLEVDGKTHVEPFFKLSWSPEFLRSVNYITHFAVIKHNLVKKVGGFRKGYEGAQDWDLFLRISRETDKIHHIPTILYSWRKSPTSTASAPSAKDYAYVNQKKALQDDVKARGLKADIRWQIPLSMWRVDYKLAKPPKVSIVIPTKNQYEFISQCLKSIEKTTYKNFEIVVVDTGSDDDAVWGLYDEYKNIFDLTVVKWTKEFNFSGACNLGAQKATGQYLLFLNNDTEVISPDWVESMVGYASQSGVGAVGCKLYYPTGQLQHGGIILGVGGQNGTPGIAGHFFPAFKENPPQDPAQLLYDGGTRNFAAVTAACIMVDKDKFAQVKQFDTKFKIAFNDVDFCLKLLSAGYRNVYLPHVELYHHESVSIGRLGSKVRDPELFNKEINMMIDKWGKLIANDPYYHPEFRKDIASARLKVSRN